MKPTLKTIGTICLTLLWAGSFPAQAQRQMEKLGRGVVALHSATSQAYVSWRLFATDPSDIGFNIYRSANGATGVKLNSTVITNTTDFLDTTANFTISNAWYVVPVISGVEQTASAPCGLAANSSVRQYVSLPLQPVTGGLYPPYDVKLCWVGDFDGDGEYDYLVDRLSTTTAANQYLQAYKRDGTLLWQMDMGYNSTNQYAIEPGASAISVGHGDNVTVYDLDGDGKAEVIVRTAKGVTFGDGAVASGPDDTTQYLSIIDGLTGHELTRATITNMWPVDGPMNAHYGIMYCDGARPSVLIHCENRNSSEAFQRETMTYDYRDGQLIRRWFHTPANGANESWGHQIRIMDVNHDGIDDLLNVGSALNGVNGQPLFDTELIHGDRFHITDIDPERPGLEMYAIQQNNSTLLATAFIDPGNGQIIKKWYASGIVDVGRGTTLDLDPSHRGLEFYSTQPGIFDCKGTQIFANNIWPPEALWWDADLSRELEDGAGSGAYSPVINKFDPVTGTAGRLYSIYNEGVHQAYGGRAAFWGDILGDWREEVVLVANDYSELRVYTTKIAATNRIYCLMQNPSYRVQTTCKGYYQASYVDYYLGTDMPAIPVPPVSDAAFVWRGGASSVWDNATVNWFTNNLWISNTTAVALPSVASVLFDLTGSNTAPIAITGTLTPLDVRIHSPKNYTFDSSAGDLTGPMKLTKAGAGKLTLNGTNTYTGATLVGEGAFLVNGSLPNSAITVRGGVWLDGRLGGTGVVGGVLRFEEGAGFSPSAGTNSPGTLTIANNVTFTGRTLSDFDLSDDPTGTLKTNDLVKINGNLTLQAVNTINIRKLNATLPPGVYPLINYSGTLTGGLNNLVISGLPGLPIALTNPPGQIALVVKSYRAPATINWTGGTGGSFWDLLLSYNFLNGATKAQFVPGDVVRFDSIGTSNLTATLSGDLNAAAVIVDSTANYTLAGSGGIIGSASLTKSNTGTLTISALNNSYTGKTTIAGGTVIVSELDAVGYPSPLGNPPAGSTNLILSGSSTLRVTGESYTDRGMTLNAGQNTLDIFNAADQVTIAGQIIGSGTLVKAGAGNLALNVANTFSGGVIISNGAISLGSVAGNQTGVGTGSVTFYSGTLSMINIQASETAAWPIIVPTGATGRLDCDGRCTLSGALTGGGTFNVMTPYVRTDFNGNWSAFTGQLNIITDSDGGDFRCNNSAGYPNAKINLAALVSLQNRLGSTPTISIGELSGSAGCNASAGGGNSGLAATWSVGGLNTSATFAGNTYNGINFIKVGTGTWTWTGTNITHTGTTTVNGGTLLMNGNAASASGNVTVGASGTLGGTGTIGGATTVNGKLAPGSNAIGTLNFNGNLTFSASGTALIEINKTANTKDVADAVGTLTYGGTLQVTNLSGALTSGDSFKIFDAAAYAGAFSTFNLPTLGSGLAWSTAGLTTSGTINVVSTNALPPPPDAPTNLVATATSYSQINLTWSDASTNETSFLIERSTNNVDYTQIASVGAGVTGYSSTGLNASTLYYYRVRASNSGGNSAYSNIASATTLAAPAGLVWRGDGSSNLWDVNTTSNWRSNGTAVVFTDGLTAIFDDSGSNNVAVSLSGLIAPDSVLVTAAKNYTFSGTGSLSNAMPLIKTGSGTLTISSAQAYTGSTFVGGGTFALTTGASVGSGSITFSNGTTFSLSTSGTPSTFIGSPISVVAGATVTMTSGNLANGYSGPITSGDDQTTFIIASPISMDGQNLKQFQNFLGTVQINSGAQLRFSKSSGVNNGGDATRFIVNGTLNTRNGGAVACGSLNGNSTGLLSGGGSGAGTTTFTIGALGVDSTFTGNITDANATGLTALIKTGAGALTLSGTNTYSGTTTISGGALQIGNGGTTGTLPTNNIANNAALTFNRANNLTDGTGIISGTGSVIQDGDGTVTFTKNHTYSGATLINSGALALTGSGSISNSSGINIASGATLDVSGRSSGNLVLTSGKTLSGSGAVNGDFIIASGAKLAPGNSLGTLTFSNNLTLAAGSTTTLELSKPPLANDRVNVLGTLACGGTLIITNTSGNALAAGDSFQLFNAPLFSGTLSGVTLPALTGNLFWNTNGLYTTGIITVTSPISTTPTNIAVSATASNLTITWPASHIGWTLQAQTNTLDLGLGATWHPVSGSPTTNQMTFPVNPANPTVFYRLALP